MVPPTRPGGERPAHLRELDALLAQFAEALGAFIENAVEQGVEARLKGSPSRAISVGPSANEVAATTLPPRQVEVAPDGRRSVRLPVSSEWLCRENLRAALFVAGGNKKKAGDLVGVNRLTVMKRLKADPKIRPTWSELQDFAASAELAPRQDPAVAEGGKRRRAIAAALDGTSPPASLKQHAAIGKALDTIARAAGSVVTLPVDEQWLERANTVAALRFTRGQLKAAADLIGRNRVTLYKWMQRDPSILKEAEVPAKGPPSARTGSPGVPPLSTASTRKPQAGAAQSKPVTVAQRILALFAKGGGRPIVTVRS